MGPGMGRPSPNIEAVWPFNLPREPELLGGPVRALDSSTLPPGTQSLSVGQRLARLQEHVDWEQPLRGLPACPWRVRVSGTKSVDARIQIVNDADNLTVLSLSSAEGEQLMHSVFEHRFDQEMVVVSRDGRELHLVGDVAVQVAWYLDCALSDLEGI